MIGHCPTGRELADFANGRLPPDAAESVGRHLAGCADCEAEIEVAERQSDWLLAVLRSGESASAFSDDTIFARARAQIVASAVAEPVAPAATAVCRVGHYELLEKLGAGGMGTVYRALHTNLRKLVAIKLLPDDKVQDEAAVRRFRQEMAAVGQVDHPNIVRALDAGEADGRHYLVMELVDGIDLSRLIQQHGLPAAADACELIRQAAVGLAHAHEQKLVHRDIKPSNIMLARRAEGLPVAKILDLGLARLRDTQRPQEELTHESQMMGTLDYMAPEQAASTRDADIRADIYSLGATLYKLLCGRAPFDSRDFASPVHLLASRLAKAPPPITSRRPDLPAALAAIVDRMLSYDPNDRPQTPREVVSALGPFAVGNNLSRLLAPLETPSEIQFASDGSTSTCNFLAQPKTETKLRPPIAEEFAQPRPAKSRQLPRKLPNWMPTTAAAALVGVTLAAVVAATIYVSTDYGTLEIIVPAEVQETVKVEVLRGGEVVEIVDLTSHEKLRLRKGKYELQLAGDRAQRLRLTATEFELHRGGRRIAHVVLRPPVVTETISTPPAIAKPPANQARIVLRYGALDGYLGLVLGHVQITHSDAPLTDEAVWIYETKENGHVKLKHAASGKYLDHNGKRVGLTERASDPNTTWALVRIPAGSAGHDTGFALIDPISRKYLVVWSDRITRMADKTTPDDVWQWRPTD